MNKPRIIGVVAGIDLLLLTATIIIVSCFAEESLKTAILMAILGGMTLGALLLFNVIVVFLPQVRFLILAIELCTAYLLFELETEGLFTALLILVNFSATLVVTHRQLRSGEKPASF